MLLIATGYSAAGDKSPPLWVAISAYSAIGLGTMFGGWRIVKTMGQKITKLKPYGGFCAEGAGAITLFLNTFMGVPVSTTHTITGAIVGLAPCNVPVLCVGALLLTSFGHGYSPYLPAPLSLQSHTRSACICFN